MKLGMQIIVIVLLLLAAAALVLGSVLFRQREMLKGRTQKLETAIHQVAGTIEASDGSDVKLAIPPAQLKTYKQTPGGPPPMDISLNQLTLAAQNQLGRLNGVRSDLSDTKATLAKTETDLKTTQTNLANARTEIGALNETVAARNTTISEKEGAIKTLEREKGELTGKVEEQTTKITGLETETNKLSEQVASLKKENEDLKTAKAKDPGGPPQLAKGRHGNVIYVDPEWNFLVIGLASEDSRKNAAPNVEFMLHRADKLVGKVRVKAIEGNVAIADIMSDWLQIMPQKGDSVIY